MSPPSPTASTQPAANPWSYGSACIEFLQQQYLKHGHQYLSNMDNKPTVSHWLEPHAQPALSQEEIKAIIGSPNCVNLQISDRRTIRRTKLLLTKQQKDYISLRTATMEIPFSHSPPRHRQPIILSKMETDVINDITIACQPIDANQIQQKTFVLTVPRTDISQLCKAILEHNKIARAFKLYDSLDPMLRKEQWNYTLLPYPMGQCVHCLRHVRRYELDNRLRNVGTFEDWAVKLVQLLWLGCNSKPKCLHCHMDLSEHPATKCSLCKKKYHCKCLIQCGLKLISGKHTKAGDCCGGTYCDMCMWNHQCRYYETWNIDAQEECRDISTLQNPPPNVNMIIWRELFPFSYFGCSVIVKGPEFHGNICYQPHLLAPEPSTVPV